MASTMNELLNEIRACTICKASLELCPRPILSASVKSKITIIGQAPGSIVHKSGIPWDDKSGQNLRKWMGIASTDFYNPDKIAILPMGFCYPGKGKSADLPPRPECAPKWHDSVMNQIERPELILLIGKYAQDHYLKASTKATLTETVKNFKEYLPKYFVLPHPSPRNNIWQAKNAAVLPELKRRVDTSLK